MGQVARYDVANLRRPERTPQGFLRADAVMTRSGVFVYRNPDGTLRREYRPPEEVFRADTLKSFEDAPLTKMHPGRLVDPSNVTKYSVGSVKEAPRRDGSLAISRVVVTDSEAIASVESGKLRAVSCGYECDYDPTPGVSPEGERYDGVQRNIVGNHLALVPAGRAGPEATIRLDAADAVMVVDDDEPTVPKEIPMAMVKVRLDGVEFEVSEQVAQAIAASQLKAKEREDALTAQTAEANKAVEAEKARADAAKEDAAKLKKERDDALDPAKRQESIQARVDLEKTATEILGEVKLDGKTDDDIKRMVVEKVHPGAKERLDAATKENYATVLNARYDAALESFGELADEPDPSLGAVRVLTSIQRKDSQEKDSVAKFHEDEANAWKAQQSA